MKRSVSLLAWVFVCLPLMSSPTPSYAALTTVRAFWADDTHARVVWAGPGDEDVCLWRWRGGAYQIYPETCEKLAGLVYLEAGGDEAYTPQAGDVWVLRRGETEILAQDTLGASAPPIYRLGLPNIVGP